MLSSIRIINDEKKIGHKFDTNLYTLQVIEIGNGQLKVYINGKEHLLENVTDMGVVFYGDFIEDNSNNS